MGANVYEIVNSRIIDLLERGTIPWRKPWATSQGMPRNLASMKEYRGINVFLLACQQYSSPYWLTYKQAEERGGHIRKGEKSTMVVFWKLLDRSNSAADENSTEDSGVSGRVPLLRYYNVFNFEQCENIASPSSETPTYQFTQIERSEQIIKNMTNRPEISYGGNRASYTPVSDKIRMPYEDRFEKSEEFYSVLFHELGHSTGHQSRLGRKEVVERHEFGSEEYSAEELCAEFCSSFLCGVAGISNQTIELAASYIDGWLNVLKKDKKMLVVAAARAQAAADYILGRKHGEEEL
ncbi:ArdC family protein [Geobacter argillaceus]|uniref:Antirestriction protein ArdC n=1 Tax=Geobacter argillaceus TaxID=345631 RepID=A0A562V6Y6_9BACT|nr:ArdC-like ssDNA-binding domain-containing protein [Geobacter argillaceus]TWJ13679.1 antirestriction protein ArdC [Geobacter argillaceus]